jgi:sugar phosphate isomerase/epimerase
MKIGMITDSLGHLALDELLPTVADLGLEALEFACANWSTAPHLNLDQMLESEAARREFMAKVKDHGLEISALNCSGNQLAPGDTGKRHDEGVRKTFKLASLMGIDRVVMMSGLPGGPGDRNPNWITTAWPPQATEILNWQWDQVAIPYWRELVGFGREQGITRIAIEIHGGQLVYNTSSMVKLREAAGETVGANLDPSHMMWMGGEPLSAVRVLSEAIFYVHAKDTRIDPANAGPNTCIETRTNDQVAARSWNYVTLGYGHGEGWWRDFAMLLRSVGYDDVLSIEHEDYLTDPLEGVRKSVELLQRVIPRAPASYAVQQV